MSPDILGYETSDFPSDSAVNLNRRLRLNRLQLPLVGRCA